MGRHYTRPEFTDDELRAMMKVNNHRALTFDERVRLRRLRAEHRQARRDTLAALRTLPRSVV